MSSTSTIRNGPTGESDIAVTKGTEGKLGVEFKRLNVYDPTTGQIRSASTDDIACWFIDTDYNKKSFFVRHAFFARRNDPFGALKTTLEAEINPEAPGLR